MDFVRLGERYTTSYIPDRLIEGYNSLIWTERYQAHGEFELKSFDVDGLTALLPEDTLVSHLETREVMRVDTHEVNLVGEGQDATPEITIRGQSATNILEDRFVEAIYQRKRSMRRMYSAASAAAVLLVNAVDNTSGKDLTRGDTAASTPELNDYPWGTQDAIPNISVTESAANEGPVRWYQLQEGNLYPQLMNILLAGDLGLRLIRPISPTPGVVLTVKSALAERGIVVRTSVSDVPGLQFNVYGGVDRSATVKLSQLQGHLDKPQYLSSSRGFKTTVEMKSGEIDVSDVYRNATEKAYTGFRRRVMEFDAGTPEIPSAPEGPEPLRRNATKSERDAFYVLLDKWIDDMAVWRNKRAAIINNFREAQSAAALVELKKARRINMFSGDVSINSPYIYKTHYDLGDIVMLHGDYNKTAKMQVAEYVRTEDINGDRGFPGLVEP